MDNTNQRVNVAFMAIDPYLQTNIISPTEKRIQGKDFVEWGDGNLYPEYLLSLYNTCPTLRSIINGNIDFIAGDDMRLNVRTRFGDGIVNKKGDTITEQAQCLIKDFEIYGGWALQIIRDHNGDVAETYYIDMRFLRMNKECDVFYYCEDWKKVGTKKTLVYPAFNPSLDWALLDEDARKRNASSILFVKNVHTQVYPAPLYAASIKDCEIERNITEYHLNSIANGFCSSMIVNFNNGIPNERQKEEIAADFEEKFTGQQNAGRVMFSWNKSKDNATTFETPKIEDFGDRYQALSTHSRQQIFAAFRAIPALFGIMTESTGFNEQEFSQAFKLYNRTQIRPVQRKLCDTYDKVFGVKGAVTILPFSIEDNQDSNVN